MKPEIHRILSIYHSNLRNIGIFITISLAVSNMRFKLNSMKQIGIHILVISFLMISFMLNLQIFDLIEDNSEHLVNEELYIVPYLTIILIVILVLRFLYTIYIENR